MRLKSGFVGSPSVSDRARHRVPERAEDGPVHDDRWAAGRPARHGIIDRVDPDVALRSEHDEAGEPVEQVGQLARPAVLDLLAVDEAPLPLRLPLVEPDLAERLARRLDGHVPQDVDRRRQLDVDHARFALLQRERLALGPAVPDRRHDDTVRAGAGRAEEVPAVAVGRRRGDGVGPGHEADRRAGDRGLARVRDLDHAAGHALRLGRRGRQQEDEREDAAHYRSPPAR